MDIFDIFQVELLTIAITSSGCQVLLPWPGYEADYSLPSSAKVKNAWSYMSTSPVCPHGVVLN